MEWEMSRDERLERWAVALETCGVTRLTPFYEAEFISDGARAGLRQANSPLDIAYRDPVLRRAGLDSDRYGDGIRFFGLSRQQAHRILCSCGYLNAMRPGEVARRIRATATRRPARRWLPTNPVAALARRLCAWRPSWAISG